MNDAALVDLIRRAVREAVREEFAALRPRRPLARADLEWLSLLLPAIDAAAGDAILTTAEIAGRALRPGNDALAAALVRYATSMKALGKAFARTRDCAVGDFELRHVGNASGAALWQCVRVSNSLQTNETLAADIAPVRTAA